MISNFDYHPRTRVAFGTGRFAELGALTRECGIARCLIVADEGVRKAGYVARAVAAIQAEGIETFCFHDFDANPDTRMVEAGRAFAQPLAIDGIIGLGGGSSLDCAKGINFLLTNGGSMKDYWGWAKASQPMLPMIGVPTTAGTGSEAQTYALISDADTHVKMACGDPKAAFRIALLDPEICVTAPLSVRATAGYDALSHAVETWVTTKRNPISLAFSSEAFRLIDTSLETVMRQPDNVEAMGQMLLGSHLAGMAIENSMLGATHACANPLTARYGTVHGVAIALLLQHVVTFNGCGEYSRLHPALPQRLNDLAAAAGLPRRLRDIQVPESDIPHLAEAATQQWTGKFNPRPLDIPAAKEIYTCAW
jgi:alcohol dehydrogenase